MILLFEADEFCVLVGAALGQVVGRGAVHRLRLGRLRLRVDRLGREGLKQVRVAVDQEDVVGAAAGQGALFGLQVLGGLDGGRDAVVRTVRLQGVLGRSLGLEVVVASLLLVLQFTVHAKLF